MMILRRQMKKSKQEKRKNMKIKFKMCLKELKLKKILSNKKKLNQD